MEDVNPVYVNTNTQFTHLEDARNAFGWVKAECDPGWTVPIIYPPPSTPSWFQTHFEKLCLAFLFRPSYGTNDKTRKGLPCVLAPLINCLRLDGLLMIEATPLVSEGFFTTIYICVCCCLVAQSCPTL